LFRPSIFAIQSRCRFCAHRPEISPVQIGRIECRQDDDLVVSCQPDRRTAQCLQGQGQRELHARKAADEVPPSHLAAQFHTLQLLEQLSPVPGHLLRSVKLSRFIRHLAAFPKLPHGPRTCFLAGPRPAALKPRNDLRCDDPVTIQNKPGKTQAALIAPQGRTHDRCPVHKRPPAHPGLVPFRFSIQSLPDAPPEIAVALLRRGRTAPPPTGQSR